MKFGASSFIWTSPFTSGKIDLFDVVKNYGFDFFEIAIEDPQLINPQLLKKKIEDSQLPVVICGVFGLDRDISSVDYNIRNNGLKYLKTCIDYAEILGAQQVIGPMYSAVGKTNLLSPEEKLNQWKLAVENLKIATQYAGERSVRLALEPLNRFETDFINTVEQGLELIQKVGATNLGFLLDVFHMHIEEKNSGAAIKLAGDRLYHLHACSNDRGIPGTGQIQWNDVKDALAEIGYDGLISIESFTPDLKEIAKAVSFWREIFPSSDVLAREGLSFLHRTFR